MDILKSIKRTTIIILILSGWVAFAWLKADLWPNRIDPLPIHRRVEIVAQKPGKGQEWAIYDGAKVRYLQAASKSTDPTKGGTASGLHPSPENQSGSSHPQTTLPQQPEIPEGGVLPLGRYLLPSGGRDPFYVTPELDPVSGETKLQVEPAGGYARFGGERYAFMDFSYQKLLQSDFSLSDAPALSIGLHQDLGRVGKMELMAEGWLQASVLESQLDKTVELGVGVRLRVALPF